MSASRVRVLIVVAAAYVTAAAAAYAVFTSAQPAFATTVVLSVLVGATVSSLLDGVAGLVPGVIAGGVAGGLCQRFVSATVVAMIFERAHSETSQLIVISLVADVAATLVVYAWSRAVDNTSVYDPYWSVVTPALVVLWNNSGLYFWSLRGIAVGSVITVWALRLTGSCLFRWNSLSHEDWRYVHFRESRPKMYWAISLWGLHLMPTAMVFAGSLPLYPALNSSKHVWFGDYVGVAVMFGGVLLEAVADAQLDMFRAQLGGSEGGSSSGKKRRRRPRYVAVAGVVYREKGVYKGHPDIEVRESGGSSGKAGNSGTAGDDLRRRSRRKSLNVGAGPTSAGESGGSSGSGGPREDKKRGSGGPREDKKRGSGGRPLLNTGVWGVVRHPNYTGELLFWIGLAIVGVSSAPGWWPACAGALAIVGLISGTSAPWLDERSLSRRSNYADYMAATASLVPGVY